MQYRLMVYERAKEDSKFRKEEWIRCSRDIYYWMGVYLYVYEPRIPKVIPFLPWQYQGKMLRSVEGGIEEHHDVLVEKSRDMGVTWVVLALLLWRWQFHPLCNFLITSYKQDMVDASRGGEESAGGDPATLFAKLDFMIKHLPWYLKPRMARGFCHMENLNTGSAINGSATTSEIGRAGRSTAVFLDEFATVPEGDDVLASSQATTDCRIIVSTPKGTANAFYRQREKMLRTQQHVLTLHWSEHPRKRQGLYTDPNKPGRFKFRSNWYENEIKRFPHPALIAQELDIDYLGSSFCYFDELSLERFEHECVREPIKTGDVLCDPESRHSKATFVERQIGPLKLWVNPRLDGTFDLEHYCIGIDVAAGSRDVEGRGASLSVCSVAEIKTGVKLAEYVVHGMFPRHFARICVSLARLFSGPEQGALLIWDAQGPGRELGDAITKTMGYMNVYFRKKEDKINAPLSDIPGFPVSSGNKEMLLGRYREALSRGLFINRSREAISECRMYQWTPTGIEHASSKASFDPSGARSNHGDRVIADSLCWWGIHERRGGIVQLLKGAIEYTADNPPQDIPVGCLYWRRKEAEKSRRLQSSW